MSTPIIKLLVPKPRVAVVVALIGVVLIGVVFLVVGNKHEVTEQATDNVQEGRISFGLTGIGYRSSNMGTPPFWRAKRAPSTVVDVGAFDGQDWTIPAAKAGHRVYTFEPGANKIRKIKEKLEAYNITNEVVTVEPGQKFTNFPETRKASERPNVYLMNVAVSIQTSSMKFVITNEDSPVDTLAVKKNLLPCKNNCQFVDVPVVRLDEVIDEDLWILKVDTQGFDCYVIHGAEKLLRSRKVEIVTFEFAPVVMDATGCKPLSLLEFMHQLGYQCFDWFGLSKNIKDPPHSLPFKKYLEIFEEAHDESFVGSKWTEILCFRHDYWL